jgi:hypothetical protein
VCDVEVEDDELEEWRAWIDDGCVCRSPIIDGGNGTELTSTPSMICHDKLMSTLVGCSDWGAVMTDNNQVCRNEGVQERDHPRSACTTRGGGTCL